MDKNKALVKFTSPSAPWKALRWPAVMVSGLVLLVVWGVPKHSASQDMEPEAQRVLPVKTQRLDLSAGYMVEKIYSGEIQARRVSDIGFEMTGTLIDLPLKEGDRVQKGTVLARLDTRSLDAQKKQLQAQRRQAEAQLSELETGPRQEEIGAAQATVQDFEQQALLAERLSDRRKKLYEQGAVSRESYEERSFNARALRKRQEQAQQRLDELRAGTRVERVESQDAQLLEIDARMEALDVQRSKAVLVAPFSGRIAQKLVSEGVVLNAGQPILRLVEAGAMEARIGLPQAIADRLKIGQKLPIQVGQDRYPAQVSAFLPELEATSRTVTVVLEFMPRSPLTIGQTAQLIWQQDEKTPGFWLPTTAVVAGEQGLWSAYVVKSENGRQLDNADDSVYTVARRDVEVIHTAGNRVYVRGMLSPGDDVISQGTHRLAQGQLVKID